MSDYYSSKLDALADGTLDPNEFNHLDHIGVAFEALGRFDFFDALAIVAGGIKMHTEKAGVPDKFNATITLASMSLIAERSQTEQYSSADEFVELNADLFSRSFLTSQFPDGRISTELARAIPLLPKYQF